MPNSFLPSVEQGGPHTKEGVILLGDAWNMRHPLTGGGMTVALSDVVLLAPMLAAVPDLADWHAVAEVLHRWHWARKPLSATINILSIALYDLFGADGTSPFFRHTHTHPALRTRTLTFMRIDARGKQINISPFCELDASSTLSVAANAFVVRSRCSRGGLLSHFLAFFSPSSIDEKHKSQTRSRLALQSFLLCGSVRHLGHLYTSAARECFG